MFSEINKTFKYILIGAALVLGFVVISKIQSCNGPDVTKPPVEVVEPNKVLSPLNKAQEKYLPANTKGLGVIVDKSETQDPSKIIEKTHIIHTDPNGNTGVIRYTDVIKVKNVYGLRFEPKFYAGYTNGGLTLGLGAALVRLNKVTLDGLVTFPYIGLGTSYQVTNNTFVGLGANLQYLDYKEIGDFSTYSVKVPSQNGILPLVYFGARF